jgi:hypothetical protein
MLRTRSLAMAMWEQHKSQISLAHHMHEHVCAAGWFCNATN